MIATMKLYEATDAIEIVRDWIFEHDEELRANEGVLPDELAELLAQVEGDFATKAERVALFARELAATGKAIKEEEERLRARRKSMESTVDGLKRYLELNMLQAEKMRIDGKLVTLRIQRNPAHVEGELSPEDLEALADAVSPFVTVVPETYRLNAKAVIDHWKQYGDTPLAGLAVVQGASLRIV